MLCPTPTVWSKAPSFAIERRQLLTGLAALASASAVCAREPLTRRGTPQLTTGPFFPLNRPTDQDWDLTRVAGGTGVAQGVIMELRGRITTETGKPVANARLDVWQTNGLGRYHHPSDETGKPLDPNFQGSAVIHSDDQGDYRLRTVMPLPYERRQRHIHFDVRGEKRMLITQMFFPGEPNERDTLYPALQSEALQKAVTAQLLGEDAGLKLFRWNIVLAGE
jgi:protocatechuate 3,4-dioxygenase beta subunit